ncbi:hypothetical protein QE152_g34241 [Popillia japonica]|uniref:C2H2-type domain-containing protein n=1 Tax=Popillia japonica TaxID=7064 RepID=A0AAW1ITK5_POPJA
MAVIIKKKHKSELVRENEGNSKVSAAETKPKEVEPKPKGVEPKSKEVEPKPKEVLPKPKEVVPKPKEVMAKSKEVVPKPKEVVSKSKIDPAILKGDNPSPTTPVKDVLPKKKLNEQKPRKNELDFLHEDIKEMWMSGDIVRATGRRACTLTSKEEVAVIDTVKESTEKDDDADLRRSMIENASKLKVWIKRENFAKYFEKLTENCDESQRPVKKQKSRFPKKNLVIPENDNKNEHHDRNYYVQGVETPCRLCNYNGKMIFTHYKGKHPNNEVLISRLAPHIAEQLIVTSTERNYKNFNILDDLKVKCTFICPFCPNSNVISDYTAQFYDHLTIHTGEYRYFCERCDFSWYNQWNMRYHNKVKHRLRAKVITKNVPVNSEIVFGYICLECHFVQISKRNLEKHIQDYHGNSAGVLKINLNLADLSDKNDAVHEEEVVEEAEVKVEEPQIQNNLKGENEKKDLSPFICEEDLINEKTVEEVRLEKMNDILDNVNIQNIRITMAEKLQTKLVGDSEENVQSATSAKKSYKSYPKSKPSRLFVKEGIAPDKPGPLFSGKIAGSISSIINRLQDNLQPNLAASPSIQDAQNSTRTEAMPSLIHYKDLIPDSQPQQTNKEEPPPLSHYKNLMDSNKKNEVILSAGPIRILRNPDGAIIYACFVTRCVFSSENSEQFATHCQITHGKLSYKSWRCKLCKDTFINNGLYEVFLHLLEKHLDSAILKLENSKIDLAPPDDPQGDDVIPTIDITSDSNLSDLNPKRDYIRPVPLFKLLEDSDNPETPPSLQKTPVEDEINLNSINKKFSYVIDCQLNGPQAAHFYKCPVFNCTFTSFAAQDFFAHILQHPNSYVFCLYCSNIVKLSLYFKHLEESHFSARFACSHCFYRGNNMSYVSAHIDTHHKGKDRQMVVTPIETMPTGVHMGDLPPLFTLVKPYKCAEMGCHKETIFSQEFMHHISSHKSKNVVCADCGRTLGLTILRHYAAQHGVCAFHCRYCEYGSQSADAVIRHLSEQHSNMPFLILSRKRSDKNFPSGTDEFDMMLVFTEKMIKSKYTSLIQNKDVQSVLSTITLKKKAVKRRKKGSKELIPFAQACIELSASIGGDEEISLYGTELKKQQQAKNVTKQTLINLDATPSTSSVTLNGPIATSSLLLDGTIYPSCQICGLQVTNKMCEHLPYWNSNQLYKGRVITSRLVTNQGSEVIVRNKLVADGIIQPKYVAMNRYVCGGEDCELIFELKEVLAEHLELFHSNETAYICRHCNIQLDFLSNKINIALVMKHMGVHEETIYKCRYCYFMDDVAGSMQEHTAQMHPNQENTTLLKISREQPAAKCDSESNEVIILTNSDDDNSSSVINEGSVSETQCAGDNEDDYVNVEDEDGGGADLGEDDVNFLNIITSSTTQELEEEKGLIKPYGPHYRFEKDCYKCPVCGDAIHGAIKFNNHLLDETSRIKGIYLSKSSSKEDLTDWIHKVIRHQTLILHFWTDTSNITSRVCRFCPAMCWKKRWYVHEMIHFDNAKPFQCNQCQFECFGKESIDHHTKKHTSTKVKTPLVKNSAKPTNVKSFHELTDDEKFLFEICPTSDFHNPETIFTDKIRKVCFYCKFQGNYIEIVKHCRLRHPGSDVRGFSFKCLNCEDYFDTAAVFRSHNLLCHDGNAKASFNYVGDRLHTCADCGKTYYDVRLLMLHEKTHSDSYMCKYCEFATFNWRLLAKHHFDQHAHELFDFIYDFEPSTSEVAEN